MEIFQLSKPRFIATNVVILMSDVLLRSGLKIFDQRIHFLLQEYDVDALWQLLPIS